MKNKETWIHLSILFLFFYLCPFIIKNTGLGMLILLVGFPFICFFVSLIYGIRNSFCLIYPMVVSILFIPTVYIFYNSSALIYAFLYGVISFIGMIIGVMIKNKGVS